MNFVVLYCNKNQYEMLEEFTFKYSPVDFSKVDILIYDDNSIDEQKDKLRKLCNEHSNLTWINPNVSSDIDNPVVSSFECADNYLLKNNINSNWILFFENDVFPFKSNFWGELDDTIEKNNFVNEKVGLFGFSILEKPHSGWYKDLSDDWYDADYFVVEVPNWQSVCVNRKLFRENIEIDKEHKERLLSVESVSHQFMYKGFFNIVFPKLSIYHDSGYLKNKINIKIDNSYSRSNSSHEVFKNTWGWGWGYRNKNLRNEFSVSFPKPKKFIL